MADMGEMNADLMRAPRLQPAGDQGRALERLLDAPMRDRMAAARGRDDRHFLALVRMAAERRVDRARAPGESAPGEREIFAHQRTGAAVVGEQIGEALMRGVGLGDDDQPGRVLVEPMDDARPLDAADARKAMRRNGGSAR